MTTPDPEQIAAGLPDAKKAVILALSDGEYVFPIAVIASDAQVPIAETLKIMAQLRDEGLAKYGALWDADEHRPAGSGTWLTPLGLAVRNIVKDQPNGGKAALVSQRHSAVARPPTLHR